MSNTELVKLNKKYGIRDQLIFTEGPGGFVVAEMRNPHGHGDTGRGLGASHQTGWTGLVAWMLMPRNQGR